MAASLWLQLPAPPAAAAAAVHNPLFLSAGNLSSSLVCKRHSQAPRGNLLCSRSSSNSAASAVTKEQEAVAAAAASQEEEEAVVVPEPEFVTYRDDPNFRGCRGCGQDEVERGCNGEGRIQGGIATVPGFGWWPIKAYRPCPGFVASGGRYRRQGQSMDEVASGRGKKVSSKKKQKEFHMEWRIIRGKNNTLYYSRRNFIGSRELSDGKYFLYEICSKRTHINLG